MKFLMFVFIALAWAGWLWSWGRARLLDSNLMTASFGPLGGAPRKSSPLAPPRTQVMARRRRREVMATLGLVAVTTFLIAQAWSLLWVLHLAIDGALIAYVWAVFAIERPDSVPVRPSFAPVPHPGAAERIPPGPQKREIAAGIPENRG